MFKSLLTDEDGAQVVEYALIIAVISIALVIALQPGTLTASIDAVLTRVADCFAGNNCV
ncbi:pilus assembly protein Flp/PilA [Variovorax boronicumulans]|uniref:Pilus assembly protein Flp/PilA n=1 Tax=Variovorax boronicumulans TaxID=436515 RepID=A0AAW8DP04_9BURK|nr:Flp family type IVb pilin [Variovorax boronicumulans]MDP9875907.1 pilus assembly protein Flp/PilA [Variovorax boronicumulans]MDP9917172.1 pilus assembly protein Flp/PilA [Variovorax boronicumulans]MDP9921191.1 pilus assembly protein Flp/PilA [Variovorax boronicumulans]GER15699.1 Flp family type IVb pilin [Variovorax boronicumulans]